MFVNNEYFVLVGSGSESSLISAAPPEESHQAITAQDPATLTDSVCEYYTVC